MTKAVPFDRSFLKVLLAAPASHINSGTGLRKMVHWKPVPQLSESSV